MSYIKSWLVLLFIRTDHSVVELGVAPSVSKMKAFSSLFTTNQVFMCGGDWPEGTCWTGKSGQIFIAVDPRSNQNGSSSVEDLTNRQKYELTDKPSQRLIDLYAQHDLLVAKYGAGRKVERIEETGEDA